MPHIISYLQPYFLFSRGKHPPLCVVVCAVCTVCGVWCAVCDVLHTTVLIQGMSSPSSSPSSSSFLTGKILLLDEATSACDLATDELVQKTLRSSFAESTLNCVLCTVYCVLCTVYCVLCTNTSICLSPSPPSFLPSSLPSFLSFLSSSHQAVCELCEPSYGVDMRQRRWMSQLEETAWLVRTGYSDLSIRLIV